MKKYFYLFILGVLSFCACQKNVGSAVTPTEFPTPTGAATVAPTPTATPLPTPESSLTPVPTYTPTCTPTPLPTGMPERKVKPYDETAGTIPISDEYFSDEAFRKILLELTDTDKDGMLSKQERDAVIHLGENTREVQNCIGDDMQDYYLDGLEWFRNLESIFIDGGFITVYLDRHPKISYVDGGWGVILTVFANACKELESIGANEGDVSAVILDCEKMKNMWVGDFGGVEFLYCKGTPNLQLSSEVPYCSLGTEAGIYPWDMAGTIAMWPTKDKDGNDTRFRKEGVEGERFEFSDTGNFTYWSKIDWRGWDDLNLNLPELKKQLIEKNEEYLRQELSDESDISTDVRVIFFSPEKSSLYRAESWPANGWPDPEDERTSLHYFIVNGEGNIYTYNTLDEACEAAAGMDDLKNVSLKETIAWLLTGP